MPPLTRSFRCAALAGGILAGAAAGAAPRLGAQTPAADTTTYFEFQVDKPASAAPGAIRVEYPPLLRARGVSGTVLVQFVVDAQGRPDLATFKVLQPADTALVGAVRTALASAQLVPAETGGRKVRQLMQLPFQFEPPPPPPPTDSTHRPAPAPGTPPAPGAGRPR